MKTIQERLGHSSYQITADFYAHVAEELQKDAAEKANEVLNRRKKKVETPTKKSDAKTSLKRKAN